MVTSLISLVFGGIVVGVVSRAVGKKEIVKHQGIQVQVPRLGLGLNSSFEMQLAGSQIKLKNSRQMEVFLLNRRLPRLLQHRDLKVPLH